MFNVGGSEMVVLAVLALLVFGADGLPGVIKNVVRVVRALRTAARDFQTEVRTALDLENEQAEIRARMRRLEPDSDSVPAADPVPSDPGELQVGDSSQEENTLIDQTPSSMNAETDEPTDLEKSESLTTEDTAPDQEVEGADLALATNDSDDDDGPGLPMQRKTEEMSA